MTRKETPAAPAPRLFRAAAIVGVLALLPALALWLNWSKMAFPTAQWDGWVLDSAEAIASGTFSLNPYLVHTPLYLYLLALWRKLGPDFLEKARLFNYACYFLTGWVTFALGRRLAAGKAGTAAGLTAAALYFTSPLSVQGALLLDLGDTSLVPLAASFYYCLLACGRAGAISGALLAAAFALNLWSKLIHTLFLAAAAAGETALFRREAEPRRGLLVIAAGTLLFAASWALYAYSSLAPADRWAPVGYLFNEMLFNFHRVELSASAAEIALSKLRGIFRISLWLWPPLLLWVWRVVRRGFGTHPERYFNYFLLLYMLVAMATKGTSNGFPKYHAAALPLLCALGGAWAAGEIGAMGWRRLAAPIAAAAAGGLLVFLAGDPLYTFNKGFKTAMIGDTGLGGPAFLLSLQLLAASAGAGLVYLAARSRIQGKAALFSLLAAGLAWQAALGLLQARGDYFTTYGYGTRGKAETVLFLAARPGAGAVLGPNEFEPELRAAGVKFIKTTDRCQMEKSCVTALLRDGGTGFFVFGPASNTVAQVKSFLALTPAEAGRTFSVERRGDFWIYTLGRPGGR